MKEIIKNTAIMLGTVICAVIISDILFHYNSDQVEFSMIFFLAVILTAQKTKGYCYGIIASLLSVFCVNYFFAEPIYRINFIQKGYPLMFTVMLIGSLIISTMTSKIIRQAETAKIREQNTKALYQENLKLERERDKIKMEAERETSRGILLRSVSHDLRTPLTAISGASGVLLENWEHLEEVQKKKLVQTIQEDSQWLARMVENLLSVTKIQDGITTLKKKDEVVEELIADAIQKIKQRFPAVTVSLSLPDEFLMVPMDSMLIEQVLLNLMENVVRHSENPKKIGIKIRSEQKRAIFEVEDWGKGIPEDIFQFDTSFFSGDNVRNPGLGLKVCSTIIKAHGGKIGAWNKKEGGAVFCFELPVEGENK